MTTRYSDRRTAFAALALVALAGCAGGPEVVPELGTSPRQARLALELAEEKGAVRGRVHGLDAETGRDVEARVLDVMGDAVPALGVRFTTDAPEPTPVLVVTHDLADGADPCADPPRLAPQTEPRVTAAFCDASGPIGAVSGPLAQLDDASRTRLYRRLARELFPDLYRERYGIGNWPVSVHLGATFGF